jgi:hypothetical protein
VDEIFEAFGFDGKIACGSDEFGEFVRIELDQFFDIDEVFFSQVVDGAFDIFPVGVLCQHGADHDFEWAVAGPPGLGSEEAVHGVIEFHEFLSCRFHFNFPDILLNESGLDNVALIMGKLKSKKTSKGKRYAGTGPMVGIPGYMDDVHRPVTCLMFLLPFILLYELGIFYISYSASEPETGKVIAVEMFERFLALFGASGYYLPGLAIVLILLAWQVASGDNWKFSGQTIGGMWIESFLLAIPLLVLSHVANKQVIMAAVEGRASPVWLSELLLSVSAGLYEELLFRLILIILLNILLIDVFKISEGPAIFTIVLSSAVIFSLYHYLGDEKFEWNTFVFRTMAGGYLAGAFILRGFGITVGCHIMYNVIATILKHLQGSG